MSAPATTEHEEALADRDYWRAFGCSVFTVVCLMGTINHTRS